MLLRLSAELGAQLRQIAPHRELPAMGTVLPVFGGLMILGVLLSCFTGVMPSALPALFPTRIRYGALAIGFNISVSLFGGTTPLVTAWSPPARGANRSRIRSVR